MPDDRFLGAFGHHQHPMERDVKAHFVRRRNSTELSFYF
jgi:hypothetical protein